MYAAKKAAHANQYGMLTGAAAAAASSMLNPYAGMLPTGHDLHMGGGFDLAAGYNPNMVWFKFQFSKFLKTKQLIFRCMVVDNLLANHPNLEVPSHRCKGCICILWHLNIQILHGIDFIFGDLYFHDN